LIADEDDQEFATAIAQEQDVGKADVPEPGA